MPARFRKLLNDLSDSFWVLPALLAGLSVLLAQLLVMIDASGLIPDAWLDGSLLYNGGGTGARTLLGAIATSSIGVAGTIFSITIAALTLAAGQMGPRLLRNFTRDRGNQITLGVLLGTFAYALTVLRSVRTIDEGEFIPHLALTTGVVLAFVCIGTLIFFVAHIAGRINVDTVINLVGEEMRRAVRRLMVEQAGPLPPSETFWAPAQDVRQNNSGYLQHLDTEWLASWAEQNGTSIRMLVRPGQFVFPGAIVAQALPATEDVSAAITRAMGIGRLPASPFKCRSITLKLTGMSVRALSPGINDPQTAISVLDRIGLTLCELAPLHFHSGLTEREGRLLLAVPVTDYAGLVDTMLRMIRQSAAGNAAVLIRMLEIVAIVVECDASPTRREILRQQAETIWQDAKRTVLTDSDLADIARRIERVRSTLDHPAGLGSNDKVAQLG